VQEPLLALGLDRARPHRANQLHRVPGRHCRFLAAEAALAVGGAGPDCHPRPLAGAVLASAGTAQRRVTALPEEHHVRRGHGAGPAFAAAAVYQRLAGGRVCRQYLGDDRVHLVDRGRVHVLDRDGDVSNGQPVKPGRRERLLHGQRHNNGDP
jgi:hypothetical protein